MAGKLVQSYPDHESNQLYAADIEDLRHRLDELIGIGKQILAKLSEL